MVACLIRMSKAPWASEKAEEEIKSSKERSTTQHRALHALITSIRKSLQGCLEEAKGREDATSMALILAIKVN